MNTTSPATSLEEYRMQYPNSSPIPTITQRGLLGSVLERQEQRAARRARRRAVWSHVLGLPVDLVVRMWFAATGGHPSPAARHASPPMVAPKYEFRRAYIFG